MRLSEPRSEVPVGSLVRSVSLLRSEVKLGNQELHTRLDNLQDEVRTGFDQIYRHIDGFIKLHEALHK